MSEKPKYSKEEMERACSKCKGIGKIKINHPDAKREVMCPKCKGKGWTMNHG